MSASKCLIYVVYFIDRKSLPIITAHLCIQSYFSALKFLKSDSALDEIALKIVNILNFDTILHVVAVFIS